MPKTLDFFEISIPAETQVDPAYQLNREAPERAHVRDVLQKMWRNYMVYCPDNDFQLDAAKHFQACAWQMQLTDFLGSRFPLNEVQSVGPDLRFTLSNQLVLVEAVSAKPGTGADTVDAPPLGQPYHLDNNGIIIRLRNAIDTKIKQHARWLELGVVEPRNPFVIAVTAGEISTAIDFLHLSHMEQALFPLDNGAWHVPIKQSADDPEQPIEFKYGYRGSVEKKNGSSITTDVFLSAEAKYASAVLYSPHHFVNSYHSQGRDFRLIHNPNALNPLPKGFLISGIEFWVEGDELHFKNWNQETK